MSFMVGHHTNFFCWSIKFLALNDDVLQKPLLEIVNIGALKESLSSTIKVIARCDEETLQHLSLKEEGKYRSTIIQYLFDSKQFSQKPNIKIYPDFRFEEDGVTSTTLLTKTERNILEYLLNEDYVIDKEKVADIKWGEGSYDKYSDQAIAKTVRRLDQKLKKCTIKTLPKRGYKLEVR
mgnify:CR=1 FL=1